VGIGTSSPSNKLDVTGRGRFVQDATATTGAIILRQNSGDTVGAHIQWVTNDNLSQKGYMLVDTSSNMIFATVASERMRIDSGGNWLVGKTSTDINTVGFRVEGSTGRTISSMPSGAFCQFKHTSGTGTETIIEFVRVSSVGTISTTTTSTAYNTSSDYRLKEQVTPMTGALAKNELLNPVTYKWKADGSDGQGFIAHELQAVFPDAVTGEKDAVDDEGNPVYQGVDTSFLVGHLVACIQELNAEVNALRADITALQGALNG